MAFAPHVPHNRGMQALPAIPTPRTTLTVLAPADSALLLAYRLRNRQHLAPWEAARGDDYFTMAAARDHLRQTHADSQAGTALHLAALARGSGGMLAVCSLTEIVRGAREACQLGYSVDHAHEGTGLMAEVLRAAIDHAFGALGLRRILASHVPRNTRSAALLHRLGFQRDGAARAHLYVDGRWEDMVLHELRNGVMEI
jgi:ribosomal-protein-alanine N-acetyltransferase